MKMRWWNMVLAGTSFLLAGCPIGDDDTVPCKEEYTTYVEVHFQNELAEVVSVGFRNQLSEICEQDTEKKFCQYTEYTIALEPLEFKKILLEKIDRDSCNKDAYFKSDVDFQENTLESYTICQTERCGEGTHCSEDDWSEEWVYHIYPLTDLCPEGSVRIDTGYSSQP